MYGVCLVSVKKKCLVSKSVSDLILRRDIFLKQIVVKQNDNQDDENPTRLPRTAHRRLAIRLHGDTRQHDSVVGNRPRLVAGFAGLRRFYRLRQNIFQDSLAAEKFNLAIHRHRWTCRFALAGILCGDKIVERFRRFDLLGDDFIFICHFRTLDDAAADKKT